MEISLGVQMAIKSVAKALGIDGEKIITGFNTIEENVKVFAENSRVVATRVSEIRETQILQNEVLEDIQRRISGGSVAGPTDFGDEAMEESILIAQRNAEGQTFEPKITDRDEIGIYTVINGKKIYHDVHSKEPKIVPVAEVDLHHQAPQIMGREFDPIDKKE